MRSFFCLFLLLQIFMWAESSASDRILVVHSYHEAFYWVAEINAAIKAELDLWDVEYTFFYMDTKRNPSLAWIKNAAQDAKKEIDRYKPKVVITVDDNAQAYLVKEYVNKSPIQFVFCGVNAKPEQYGYPANNVTGILERAYPVQTLHLLKTLLPNVQRVAAVTDNSPSAKFVVWHTRQCLINSNPGVVITEYLQPATFSQWKDAIRRLDQDARVDAMLIPLYHTVKKDGTHISEDSSTVMTWTLAHTRKPVVGLFPHIITDGGLLAVTVDPHEHGRIAAKIAIEIVNGKNATDIPMKINQDGYVMVNLKNNGHLPFDFSVDIDQIADLVIR